MEGACINYSKKTVLFGLSYDDKVIVKGVTGIKDNQPLFFKVTNQLIEDALRNISNSQNEVGSGFTGLSAPKDISTGILEKIRQAFYTLETKIKEGTDLDFIKSKLSYSIKATRALDSYSGAGILQDLYLEIKEKDDLHESVNLDIQAGKVHYYYKIKPVTLPTNSSDSTISNRIYQGRIKKYSRHPFHL